MRKELCRLILFYKKPCSIIHRHIYNLILQVYFSERLQLLHARRNAMRGIELYYARHWVVEGCWSKWCSFSLDLPLRWLFNVANHRESHRDLPLSRWRSLPPVRLGLSFFPPRCLDTSTYVYARERMRANNGPACIWNSINSPNISSSSEINLIVPRWKWWHHY